MASFPLPFSLFLFLYRYNLLASIGPTMRADMVRQKRFMTLGAMGKNRGFQFVMGLSLTPSGG
jgi:hypothetical protein